MPERTLHFLGLLPFLLMTKTPTGESHITVNWTRIVEAILIAAISGFFAGYVAVKQLEVKFDLLSEQVKTTQGQLFQHINKP